MEKRPANSTSCENSSKDARLVGKEHTSILETSSFHVNSGIEPQCWRVSPRSHSNCPLNLLNQPPLKLLPPDFRTFQPTAGPENKAYPLLMLFIWEFLMLLQDNCCQVTGSWIAQTEYLLSYSLVRNLMKKYFKSLTTPRNVGGISPQQTGIKVLQTQA